MSFLIYLDHMHFLISNLSAFCSVAIVHSLDSLMACPLAPVLSVASFFICHTVVFLFSYKKHATSHQRASVRLSELCSDTILWKPEPDFCSSCQTPDQTLICSISYVPLFGLFVVYLWTLIWTFVGLSTSVCFSCFSLNLDMHTSASIALCPHVSCMVLLCFHSSCTRLGTQPHVPPLVSWTETPVQSLISAEGGGEWSLSPAGNRYWSVAHVLDTKRLEQSQRMGGTWVGKQRGGRQSGTNITSSSNTICLIQLRLCLLFCFTRPPFTSWLRPCPSFNFAPVVQSLARARQTGTRYLLDSDFILPHLQHLPDSGLEFWFVTVSAKSFFFPLAQGGFTPPYSPGSPDGGFPRHHPARVGPPDRSGISPMDQGVLGCRNHGNLPSCGTPGLPPAFHQVFLPSNNPGRMPVHGKHLPLASPLLRVAPPLIFCIFI